MNAQANEPGDVLRYAGPAIALHWAMAILVLVVGVLGLLHDSWPKRTQGFWINLHALLGLLVLVMLLVRLWWRGAHAPPPLPLESGELSRRLSRPAHLLLYLLMIVIPVFGIVTFIWHGRAFDFGFFKLALNVRSNRAVFHPTEDIHGYLAYALFALIGIHSAAAIWHQLYRRDRVMSRMWPPKSAAL